MKKMQNLFILILVPAIMFISCKRELIEANINPNAVISVDPGLQFSGVLVASTASQNAGQPYSFSMDLEPRTNYCHGFMQYGYTDFWSGTNYQISDGIASRYWNSYYSQVLKNLEYLIPILQQRPDLVNTYAAARIWKVLIYQKLTDFYGDVPYSQAAKAFSQQIFAPAYDKQEDIYDSLINELQTVNTLFTTNETAVKGDQFYGGNIENWKKLGNSLLLRIGMRLIKVDAARAASLVQEAVSGGVMESNNDMPVLKHNANAPNAFFYNLGDQHFFLHKTFVDHLKTNHDPRLSVYGNVYDQQRGNVISTDTADFIGFSPDPADPLPNVRVNYAVFQPATTPFFDFHYAQVEFLLAEATLRGFITGDAGDHYNKAVTAHMNSLALLPTNPTITDQQITTYLTQNPMVDPLDPSVERQIERINTEFWVSGFMFDADEVWANWRRSGYPKLTPNQFTNPSNSSSPGMIPRKMTYPESEMTQNSAELTKALSNYGGTNNFLSRVWWDQ